MSGIVHLNAVSDSDGYIPGIPFSGQADMTKVSMHGKPVRGPMSDCSYLGAGPG
jgi:hypothetical protein